MRLSRSLVRIPPNVESFVAAVFLKKDTAGNRVFEKEHAFSSPASRPTTRPSTGFPVSIRKNNQVRPVLVCNEQSQSWAPEGVFYGERGRLGATAETMSTSSLGLFGPNKTCSRTKFKKKYTF